MNNISTTDVGTGPNTPAGAELCMTLNRSRSRQLGHNLGSDMLQHAALQSQGWGNANLGYTLEAD